MKTSESVKEITPAFIEAQKQIGGAVKGSENTFYTSKYADLNQVIMAVKGPCLANDLAFTQTPIGRDGFVGIRTRVMHVSGEWMESEVVIPAQKIDPQSCGQVLTYFRRYALAGIFNVPQLDDDAESAMFEYRKTVQEWTKENAEAVNGIKIALDSQDYETASIIWFELEDDVKTGLWVAPSKGGPFTTEQRAVMKSKEFKEAYYGKGEDNE